MPPSFVAYIDESGDQGFVFREDEPRGSSRWFVLSAVVVRAEDDTLTKKRLAEIRQKLRLKPEQIIHFSDLNHDRRVSLCDQMATYGFDTISVLVEKERLENRAAFTAGSFRLYFYATRLLLERLSWYARDWHRYHRDRLTGLSLPAQGPVKLVFERCKNLSYDSLKEYLAYLRVLSPDSKFAQMFRPDEDIRIDWGYIQPNRIVVGDKPTIQGLQLADSVASGLKLGLEVNGYGFTEHRYAKHLRQTVHVRNGNALSYGLKFFPATPEIHWVRKHFPK